MAGELANYGARIASPARGGCDFTTCFQEDDMERLLRDMYMAKDENAAQRVREEARDLLNVYDRTVIVIAERKFRELKTKILDKYPNTPGPPIGTSIGKSVNIQ